MLPLYKPVTSGDSMLNDEQIKSAIASNIRRCLLEKGMTQQKLADESGESRMTISNVCRGRHVPGLGLAHRIASVLSICVDDLITLDGDK